MLLFDRKIKLITSSGVVYDSSDGVIIRFKYTTMDDTGIPVAEIEIKNLSRELRKKIVEEEATLYIAYGNYSGELVKGDIKEIDLTDEPNVSFDLISNADIFSKEFTCFYAIGSREDYIVRDMARNNGFTVQGENQLTVSHPNGYMVNGNVLQNITKICRNRDLDVTTKGTTIIIYKPDKTIETEKLNGIVYLSPTTGLTNCLKYSSKDETDSEKYDYVVFSLPIPGLTQGDLLQIEHDNFNGRCKIIDFKISGQSNWKAEYYVKVVE